MIEIAVPKMGSFRGLAAAQSPARPKRRRRVPLITMACFAWIVGLTLAAIFAPQLAPHDPLKQNLLARNVPPVWMAHGSWDHPFGTDQIGYDILSRTLYGARPALEIGAIAAVISLVIGTTLGLLAGYFRGWFDAAIMLLVDAQLSMPFLIIAIAAVAAFGQSMRIRSFWPESAAGWGSRARSGLRCSRCETASSFRRARRPARAISACWFVISCPT
jgi:peptide/nickel transport system permease protein